MVELLAPAGDLEKLKYAYLYGADACFIGAHEYSLRARASNFDMAALKEAVKLKNAFGKKLYLTTNIIPHNENLSGVVDYLKEIDALGIDGIIVASPYIATMAKQHTNLEIHISTQQSITSPYSINYFKTLGAVRVVLGRELTIEDIKTIKQKTDLDIEVFIHGGMCASYSGRCTLSNTFTNRDANRGGCAHSCRWDYELYDGDKKLSEDILFSMSSKDLQSVKEITKLIDGGVDSLKIEGRMKSIHYIATVVNVYRMLIDEYTKTGKIEDYNFYLEEIKKAENRMTHQGFLHGIPSKDSQLYDRLEMPTKTFIGIILEAGDVVRVEQRNYFKVGDTIEVFGPSKKPRTFKLEALYDHDKNPIEVARHPKEILYMNIPFKVSKYDILRLA